MLVASKRCLSPFSDASHAWLPGPEQADGANKQDFAQERGLESRGSIVDTPSWKTVSPPTFAYKGHTFAR